MSSKIDAVFQSARLYVDSLRPEERATAQRELSGLVKTVEALGDMPIDQEIWSLVRSDPVAPSVIRVWALRAERMYVSGEKVSRAMQTADWWEEWQADNLIKTKVPD